MDLAQWQHFLSLLTVNQHEGYSKAACITFLICDICSTSYDEVRYIWRRNWTFTKFLYLFARYYAVILLIAMVVVPSIPDPSAHFCRTYVRVMSLVGSKLYLVVIDVICIIRLFALYGRNRKLLAVLVCLSTADSVAGFYCISRMTDYRGIPAPPKTELSRRFGCIVLHTLASSQMKILYIATWIPSTVNSVIFLSLTLFKLQRSVKDQVGLGHVRYDQRLRDKTVVSPLLVTFVKDGAFNFMILTAILAISAATSIYQSGLYYTPTWPWLYSVYSYAGCRLILNLRRAGNRRGADTELPVTVDGPLVFQKIPLDITPGSTTLNRSTIAMERVASFTVSNASSKN